MEPKVVEFPKHKGSQRQRSDATLLADIKAAQRKLCRAIDAALDAGLAVECQVNSNDKWSNRLHPKGHVRCIDARVTRIYT